jgi:hypothetical protein
MSCELVIRSVYGVRRIAKDYRGERAHRGPELHNAALEQRIPLTDEQAELSLEELMQMLEFGMLGGK